MYLDKITLFNFYRSSLGDMWYPHVIKNVNLVIDKAAIVAKYGLESKDNAILNIRYYKENEQIEIAKRPYLPPLEWERQTNDKLADSITFKAGNEFDFFVLGEHPEFSESIPIMDDDYDGLFNYMKENYDYVFAITSVAKYDVIPHFEITGK